MLCLSITKADTGGAVLVDREAAIRAQNKHEALWLGLSVRPTNYTNTRLGLSNFLPLRSSKTSM